MCISQDGMPKSVVQIMKKSTSEERKAREYKNHLRYLRRKKENEPKPFITSDREEYFYSLVRNDVRKKRNCLKCKKSFISKGAGNRRCGNCLELSKKISDKIPLRILSSEATSGDRNDN